MRQVVVDLGYAPKAADRLKARPILTSHDPLPANQGPERERRRRILVLTHSVPHDLRYQRRL